MKNTVQSIFETTCFTYGKVTSPVLIYEKPTVSSEVIGNGEIGEKLLLMYPVSKQQNDRWMKVRKIDPESAQLAEGWVPVFLNDVVNIDSFHV